MEVHPPHEPIHSWRDFWIHLGTITVGLLIAISLEQSVEGLHRIHQRHQLEADLHAETASNEDILAHDLHDLSKYSDYLRVVRENVDALRSGKAVPPLDPRPDVNPFLPSAGAWNSARDSSELALLPREETSIYEELYAQREFLIHFIQDWFAAGDELNKFNSQYREKVSQQQIDASKLTPVERDRYSTVLTNLMILTQKMMGTTQFYENENKCILNGVESVEELHRQMQTPEPCANPESDPRKQP